MTRLQLRIAAILISAICLVVLVSTLAAIVAITYPNPERMVGPVASQIRALSSFVDADPGTVADLADAAVEQLGVERAELTEAVSSWLRQDGLDLAVRVFEDPGTNTNVAVVKLGGQNVAVEFPGDMPPPRDLWIILGTWLGVVVIGVIAVSLTTAYRVTRPLAVLERAVATVGPDGVLPPVPEVGNREAVETAMVLNRLSQRLQAAMESRMRLVAAAGHDFRTPMTRMRLRAEFIDEEDRGAWLKDLDELEHIADSAIRLVQEEVSETPLEALSLDQLLLEEVRELAEQGYRLTIGRIEPAAVVLPRLATKRALRNLLINAATHGRKAIAEVLNTGPEAQVLIADSGPGIPEDLIQRVFEPFFRAEPGRVQTVPGAGLGLAIAAEIIERVGGRLEIQNKDGGGLLQTLYFRSQAAG